MVKLRVFPQPAPLLAVVLEADAVPEGRARAARGGEEPSERLVETGTFLVYVRHVDDAPKRMAQPILVLR